jgi:hypothetical protein
MTIKIDSYCSIMNTSAETSSTIVLHSTLYMYEISQLFVCFKSFVIVLDCSLSRDIIEKFFKHLNKKEDISSHLIGKGTIVTDIMRILIWFYVC